MTTFREWFNEHLLESAADIANHGADAGYPHITYNHDAAAIFDAHADEIWQMLVDDADGMGAKNPAEMLAGFNRADMLDDWLTTKVLLVWFACERTAQAVVAELEQAEA